MKLAGQQLMFGEGCLAHLKTLETKRAIIVTGGSSMKKNGIFDEVVGYLHEAGAEVTEFGGVEADPSFRTVWAGAEKMKEFQPDLIIGLGGGSAMDAAKMMWVYYEHPELTTLEEVLTAKPFPKLRQKALYCCIPSTSGTASEVSRSVVITGDDGMKHGLGNMEMMPDIAICDPRVTASMPPHITAETGMDAMTHALEALVSNRANYVSDVLAIKAVEDIFTYLPAAYENGADLHAREIMLNASTIAGMAFTNVSLGIVHGPYGGQPLPCGPRSGGRDFAALYHRIQQRRGLCRREVCGYGSQAGPDGYGQLHPHAEPEGRHPRDAVGLHQGRGGVYGEA